MSTYAREERRIEEDEEREILARIRGARTEDEHLEALREAGSLGAGLALAGQYAPRAYDDRELDGLSIEELEERVRSVGRSLELNVQRGGPQWCIDFCKDALWAAEAALTAARQGHAPEPRP